MAEAEDYHPLESKYKAITALLPYAVWQERDGQPEMLNTIMHAIRASRMEVFMWDQVTLFAGTLLFKASPYAVVLVSPHIFLGQARDRRDLIQQWAETVSMVPYTEEVAQCVVDTLLQIASEPSLGPHIPINLWLWLTKCPSLPPTCHGRTLGTFGNAIEVVQALKDIEVLKSYLLLVWSEWGEPHFSGFEKMCILIQEEFGGVEMGHHRADLIQQLDHVLGELDRGLRYLNQHGPQLNRYFQERRQKSYRKFKEVLLEVERCKSPPLIIFFCMLTPGIVLICTFSPHICSLAYRALSISYSSICFIYLDCNFSYAFTIKCRSSVYFSQALSTWVNLGDCL